MGGVVRCVSNSRESVRLAYMRIGDSQLGALHERQYNLRFSDSTVTSSVCAIVFGPLQPLFSLSDSFTDDAQHVLQSKLAHDHAHSGGSQTTYAPPRIAMALLLTIDGICTYLEMQLSLFI